MLFRSRTRQEKKPAKTKRMGPMRRTNVNGGTDTELAEQVYSTEMFFRIKDWVAYTAFRLKDGEEDEKLIGYLRCSAKKESKDTLKLSVEVEGRGARFERRIGLVHERDKQAFKFISDLRENVLDQRWGPMVGDG